MTKELDKISGSSPAQWLDANGVQQAFGPLGDGLAVGAALAFLLGDAGDADQHEGGQILGHLLDLDSVGFSSFLRGQETGVDHTSFHGRSG